jgi:hypothetical protein
VCTILVKLVPECAKCGSPVTDLVEPEVEEHGQLKRDRYVDSVWLYNDCIESGKQDKKK